MSQSYKSANKKLWLVLISVGLIHFMCWKASQPLRQSLLNPQSASSVRRALRRRSIIPVSLEFDQYPITASTATSKPFPSQSKYSSYIPFTSSQLLESPPVHEEQSVSLINYLRIYDEASSNLKPLILGLMILWLMFLFLFVGITAADFFCPNLSTIATRLGMSESVAGCTLLAFSNGSPDVFATFSALQAGSGSLAIGELLGAAAFITMVVSGTMCLIHPFRIPAHTFLRDVGFFALAVLCTLFILWDGYIHAWEASAMVVLYSAYVVFVAGGSWWVSRQERKREVIRQARNEYATEIAEYHDDPTATPKSVWQDDETTLSPPLHGFQFPLPSPSHPHLHDAFNESTLIDLVDTNTPVTLTRTRSGSIVSSKSPLVRRPHSKSTVRPSLLGAIEFRDVVNSLRADSTARTLAVFGGEDGHYTHADFIGDASGAGRSSATTTIDQRSRRGPHMHGRTTSNPAPMGNGGRLSMTPASPTDIRPRNTRRNSLSLILSNTDPSIGSSLPGGAEWDEQVRGRRNSVDSVMVPNLIDLGTAVHDPWRDCSTSSIGRRDRSSASRTSLPRLEIPSGLSSLNQSPASPSSTTKIKKSKMKVKLKAGEEMDLNGHIVRKRPSILLTSAAGDESTVLAPESPSLSFFTFIKPVHFIHVSRAVFLALFPSLHEWKAKSRVGKVTAVLCVPAILLLNLTLPVVDCCEDEECDAVEEKERLEEAIRKAGGYRDLEDGQITPDEYEDEDRNIRTLGSDGTKAGYEIAVSDTPLKDAVDRLARLEREAVAHEFRSVASPWIDADHHTATSAHAHSQGTDYGSMEPSGLGVGIDGVAFDDEEEDESEQEQVEEVDAEVLTRWLTAVQCTLAPVFCVCALFGPDLVFWYPIAALALGLVLSSLAYHTFDKRSHPGRIALCFVGFLVAMVWILTIVNEVVGVLQCFAEVFGLSDAIIGLTVFAMGNSIGDWVANATVANMGLPQMAISACFGGPMLNILLGLGLSGSYMIYKNDGQPYHIEVGRTLLVSGVSLFIVLIATLILVPMNNYWMNRKLGAGLIAAYCVVLATNIMVEVWK